MKADYPRLPGASTLGSQLLQVIDETAPMAGKSWQPRHEPPCKREEEYLSHWFNNYVQWKQGRVGGTTQNLCSKSEGYYNEH